MTSPSITIRWETPDDVTTIRVIHEAAFKQKREADIVDWIRGHYDNTISLVAEVDGQLVGHILFSPVTLLGPVPDPLGMGLAPLAVRPNHQNGGVGSRLVAAGLDILRRRKCPFVMVLGHPGYYPRFGFEPASRYGLKSRWKGVPNEAFQVLALNEGALNGASGVIRYSDEWMPS